MAETGPKSAAKWALSLLYRTEWVILDTETTGLGTSDEIVQIAILSYDGSVLLDTLIHPTQPIPTSATAIHGIKDIDVKNAPTFPEVFEQLRSILSGKTIVIYNAQYDLRLLNQTIAKYNLPPLKIDPKCVECAMLKYSAWIGEPWEDGTYKWQRLKGGDHTAVGDCRATLRIIREMAD